VFSKMRHPLWRALAEGDSEHWEEVYEASSSERADDGFILRTRRPFTERSSVAWSVPYPVIRASE
jgi:hypothetical protein